jgi:mannose-6-phosphate isomerase-like protein (cupin superfamily)
MSYMVKTIDQLESIHHGAVKLAGAELGIRSFGMQVLDFPAGFSDYPEHDHAEDGQEEVYVVLGGRADFVIDGQEVALSQGGMVKVDAESRRRFQAGRDRVRILAIGCTPTGAYERPEAFQIAVRA